MMARTGERQWSWRGGGRAGVVGALTPSMLRMCTSSWRRIGGGPDREGGTRYNGDGNTHTGLEGERDGNRREMTPHGE